MKPKPLFVAPLLVTCVMLAGCGKEKRPTPTDEAVAAQQAQGDPAAPPPVQGPLPIQNPAAPAAPLKFPDSVSIKLEGIPQPSGGPGWVGSAVLAAIVAGIASLIGIVISAQKRQEVESRLQDEKYEVESRLQDEKNEGDRRLQKMEDQAKQKLAQSEQNHRAQLQKMEDQAKKELAETEQYFQAWMKAKDHEHGRASQEAALGREDQRIRIERNRLRQTTNASEIEIQVSAVKLAREHGVQLANLINMFFDKLTSTNAAHRKLALYAISGVVADDVVDLEKYLAEAFDAPKSDPGCGASAGPLAQPADHSP
jgi:hypothetical protein